MLAIGDACTFDKMYRNCLDDLGVDEASALLTHCAEQANNDRLTLLCFEELTKPGPRCHRRLFAAWWEENTGYVVPELEPDVRQNRLFE